MKRMKAKPQPVEKTNAVPAKASKAQAVPQYRVKDPQAQRKHNEQMVKDAFENRKYRKQGNK